MATSIQYPYAFDEDGNLIGVSSIDIERRYDHRYFCPGCGQEMRPRIGEHNVPHFYHFKSHKCNVESYLHKTAKLLLAERFNDRKHPVFVVLRPERPCIKFETCEIAQWDCRVISKPQEYNLSDHYDLPAEIEDVCRDRDNLFRPDVLLRSSNPKRKDIFIEVYYKHRSTIEKVKSGNRIIEIRIKELADLETLRTIEKLTEGENIRFFNFSQPATPKQITEFLIEYSRECGTELPPDGLPPCKRNIEAITQYCKCPRCGGHIVSRYGKRGQFYGCSNYPNCRYTTK